MTSRTPLLLAAMLAVAAPQAAAQRYTYQQVPWRLPADSVQALVTAQGFTPSGRGEGGDLDFRREDGTRLRAELQDGRLVGFTMIDPAPGPAVWERYRAVADSLRAAHGEPDAVDEDFDLTLWEAGLTSVRMEVYRHAGQPYLQLSWRGPGWFDEMNRRADVPPQPAGFTTVSQSQFMRLAVDTTGGGPRGARTVRGRFRIAYFQPVTARVDGVEQAPLDAVIYEMEFDCAGRRTRLIGRATFLEGRMTKEVRPGSQAWSTPPKDSHYARGLDAVCRAARR
ncbi:MAG TPA: hypothetical protein VF142_16225 [Longimicrobium sp.]